MDLAEFKLIRDFIVVLVTCKNKNESVNSDIIMLPYSSLHLVTSFSFSIEYQTMYKSFKLIHFICDGLSQKKINRLFCMSKFLKNIVFLSPVECLKFCILLGNFECFFCLFELSQQVLHVHIDICKKSFKTHYCPSLFLLSAP